MLVVPFGRWFVKRFGNKIIFFHNRKIQSFTDPSITSDPKNLQSKSKSSRSDANSATSSDLLPEELYFPALYITVGTLSALLIVSLLMTNSRNQFTSNYLSTYNIIFIVIQLSLLYYDLRKHKDDSRCHLRTLVESRKQYLRYLAHEMRTPLNSAVLGLQVLSYPLNPTQPLSTLINHTHLNCLDFCSFITPPLLSSSFFP
jgi:signal transduction histidine kinase